MAKLGIDILTIQLLGRWGSDVVLRYVSEVPLNAITRRVIERLDAIDLEEVAAQVFFTRCRCWLVFTRGQGPDSTDNFWLEIWL